MVFLNSMTFHDQGAPCNDYVVCVVSNATVAATVRTDGCADDRLMYAPFETDDHLSPEMSVNRLRACKYGSVIVLLYSITMTSCVDVVRDSACKSVCMSTPVRKRKCCYRRFEGVFWYRPAGWANLKSRFDLIHERIT